ncbi:MAG TPA: SDR family NAD(P)-dependent oxidoreductase, partial [Bacillota bacterium]|nr:SDR family NAD(P)-dependent oxidoreductase [Bacillota bacterium]
MRKTAIVTGGSRGIGFAIARQLRSDGYCVAILDVNDRSEYQHNLNQLAEMGEDAYFYMKGDVRCAQDRERLVKETVDKFGGIHVLVNNAGIAPR